MQALQIREFLPSVTPALSLHFIKFSLQIANCREGIAGAAIAKVEKFFEYSRAHYYCGVRSCQNFSLSQRAGSYLELAGK